MTFRITVKERSITTLSTSSSYNLDHAVKLFRFMVRRACCDNQRRRSRT